MHKSAMAKSVQLLNFVAGKCDAVETQTDSSCEGTLSAGYRVYALTCPPANRMRIMIPVLRYARDEDNGKLATRLLEANHHSALDAKYSMADGIVWSTYMHPLSELTSNQMEDALSQVINLAATTGDGFRSSSLTFVGGPDGKKVREGPAVRLNKAQILRSALNSAKESKDVEGLPESFCDPITLRRMSDPVITPSGHSYERLTLEQIIRSSGKDPLTREPLKMEDIRPNRALKEAIEQWISAQKDT